MCELDRPPRPDVILLSLAVAAVVLLLGATPALAQVPTKQEHVHAMSHAVMPFDLSKTLHVFRMTETGGVERVVVRDPEADPDQVPLVRRHLEHEAERFRTGDYADPARLHGADMPGLAELEAGAAGITVTYGERPDGAEIRFETSDLHLLTAIHRWFGAQLSEHGADAKAE